MGGTLRPGAWRTFDPDPRTMDPESAKRLASGFWRHEKDFETCIDTWTCDKRKLNDAVVQAMLDPEFAQEFNAQGTRILDRMFGHGTEEAFRHSGSDRVAMRFDPLRNKDMAYYSTYTGSGTATTDTLTTSGTASNHFWIDTSVRKEIKQQVKNAVTKSVKSAPARLAKALYIGPAGLLTALQKDFDSTYGQQVRVIT